jgi:peroxiredoxin Q/BCP
MAAMKKTTKKSPAIYPAEGAAAPAFSAPGSNGKTVKLADYKGKRALVLYFYPRDNTSGCTKEACGFRDTLGDFNKEKVEILGVSPDSLNSHSKFIEKYDLPFVLLADEDHKMAEQYGAWQEKSNYGRTYMGIARTTFVIDKAGKIAKVFKNVKAAGHHEKVLEWVRENL